MKKIISLLMVLCLMASLCSMSAFALELPVDVPTAEVVELDNTGLTVARQFKAAEPTEEQLALYGDWYADFVIVFNKAVTFNANGSADGYLSGQYDAWSVNWVNVPFSDVTIGAYEPIHIMDYAAKMMGQSGLKIKYAEAYGIVEEFKCGLFLEPDFLAANPDFGLRLDLRIFPDPENENHKDYLEVAADGVPVGASVGFGAPLYPDDTFSLQDAVDSALNNSSEPEVELQGDIVLSEPVKIPENANIEITLNDNAFDNDISRAAGFTGSIFELGKTSSVTIKGEFSDDEVNRMRSLVSEDYCVYKGSIVIRGSHQYVNGVCECGDRLPTAVPATADNSNMPLWSLLFIGFAAVAVLTAKKKKA